MKKLVVYFCMVFSIGSCVKIIPENSNSATGSVDLTEIYCGPRTISTPLVLSGENDLTIQKLLISNPSGNCIALYNCNNIQISNCLLGPSKNVGIYLYNCTNITIKGNLFDSVSTGVYAQNSIGIAVINNEAKNMLGPVPRGQMVQFNNVTGGGNKINYNRYLNIQGQGHPEDVINIFMSNGRENDPIEVIGNSIRGGGTSRSGGGIIAGDGGLFLHIN